MTMQKALMALIVGGVGVLGLTRHASAAAIAFDSAADSVYNDGWQTGDNGGSGWGSAWTINRTSTDGNQNGYFVGSSASNGGSPNIDTNSRAWATYANSDQTVDAYRSFSGALSLSQTVRISFDNGGVDGGKVVGFGLRNFDTGNRFEFYYKGGDSVNSYKYVDSTGEHNFSPELGWNNGGLLLAFTLTGADSYSFTVTRLSDNESRTVTGLLAASGPIDHLRLFNFSAGGGDGNNAYFNSISVPEPSVMGVLFLASLPLAGRRRVAK